MGAGHHHSHGHDHRPAEIRHERPLWIAFALTLCVLLVEVAGALLIRFTGWTVVDPIVAALLGLWVLPRTWLLLRQAAHVLMQGVPAGIDMDEVRGAVQAVEGVAAVHDLHVWALGSREPVLTAHVLLADDAGDADGVRAAVAGLLRARFGIDHVTLQMEARHCGGELHP